MPLEEPVQLDEIGYWSEVKLDIIREYATAYSTILAKKRFHHSYIDGFAGPGVHVSKNSGEFIPGSPLNALAVVPPFQAFFLIDLEGRKVAELQKAVGDRPDVRLFHGDCNQILLQDVFPQVRWEDYRRGLLLLDPYGLHLNWEVIDQAAKMKTIDLFLNFPIMDINRNALRRDKRKVRPADAERMTAFWGDASWRDACYVSTPGLFGPMEDKAANECVADAFRERLRKVAGFLHVPKPMPMRTPQGVVVYYLYFASQQPVAENIVKDIFKKYADRRG
jgi:three-Cys-motif partner protein